MPGTRGGLAAVGDEYDGVGSGEAAGGGSFYLAQQSGTDKPTHLVPGPAAGGGMANAPSLSYYGQSFSASMSEINDQEKRDEQ